MVLGIIAGVNLHSLSQENEELRKTKATLESDVVNQKKKMSEIEDQVVALNNSLEKQQAEIKRDKLIKNEYREMVKHRDKKIKELRKLNNELYNKNQKVKQIARKNTYTPKIQTSNTTVSNNKNNVSTSTSVSKSNSGGSGRTMVVTAYTAGVESTGKSLSHPNYGLTASGKRVQEGVTLACPRSMPFGTQIHIEGIGTRTCFDRGGAIGEGRLDVYMNSLSQAQSFGRQTKNVKIY